MNGYDKSVFLADDDLDDCLLFEEALMELSSTVKLTTANDGIELMHILDKKVPPVPNVIFLDLNMPKKNGFECLTEIRAARKFKDIPVVILSTSSESDYINKVYDQGADYYLCKPNNFAKLKKAISMVLDINWKNHTAQPSREQFLIVV